MAMSVVQHWGDLEFQFRYCPREVKEPADAASLWRPALFTSEPTRIHKWYDCSLKRLKRIVGLGLEPSVVEALETSAPWLLDPNGPSPTSRGPWRWLDPHLRKLDQSQVVDLFPGTCAVDPRPYSTGAPVQEYPRVRVRVKHRCILMLS